MTVGRFILSVVVAYVVYAALYIAASMFLFADLFMTNAEMMRPQDDPLVIYTYVAHLVMTVAVVWLFSKAVGSNDMMQGIIFGLWIGLMIAALDSATYLGLKLSLAPFWASVAMHLVINAVVGAALALVYKPAKAAE